MGAPKLDYYNQQNQKKKTSNQAEVRIPPHSIDAEMAVLGGLMLSRQSFSRVVNIIGDESFYYPKHQMIFQAVQSLFEKNESIDILTLSNELQKLGTLEKVGGNIFIAELNRRTPSAANIEQYAMIVLEKFLKRSLISASTEVLTRAYDDTLEAVEEIDKAEQSFFELAEKRFSKSYQNMKDLGAETYDLISKLSQDRGASGVQTGFNKLDEMLGGLQNSDLIIIAARPSMGKTALGLSIALNATVINKVPTAFFSIEMAAPQIMIRLISAHGQVDQQKIRNGQLNDTDHKRILKSVGTLSSTPLFIDDTGALNILELRAKCRRLKSEHGIKLIIVDYLQLLTASKVESREREIAIISASLKQIAKELEIPVLAMAQLNRAVEARPGKDKRPMLSDLRESGSIEQDADVVMFVNRPERYGITEFEDGKSTEGMGEIIVGKQRHGPTGVVRLGFQKDYALFVDSENVPAKHSQGQMRNEINDYNN